LLFFISQIQAVNKLLTLKAVPAFFHDQQFFLHFLGGFFAAFNPSDTVFNNHQVCKQ
jgi:hypothetical protein